jgi:hypothetical protein
MHDWFVEALSAAGAEWKADSKFDWREAVDTLLKRADRQDEPRSGSAPKPGVARIGNPGE